MIHLLQLVTWFPKMVPGGGAWKILKVKERLNQNPFRTVLGNTVIIISI